MEQILTALQDETVDRCVLQKVSARGRLDGLLFELDVEQGFVNRSARNIEAVYTFPLPSDAVILALDVVIGARNMRSVAAPRAEAETRYETAIDSGDSAVMLERSGDGLYTLNVGNLLAGEAMRVRLRYGQLLRLAGRTARLTVPTVIAPRYGNPLASGIAPHQVPVTDLVASYPFTISIELAGAMASCPVRSPTHLIRTKAETAALRIELAETAALDRDFVLEIADVDLQATPVMARDGEGFVAIASFAPKAPQTKAAAPLALKILVDCSGSMMGDSIASARRALKRLIEMLQPDDRFSISRFGSTVEHLTPSGARGAQPVAADEAALAAALRQVERMEANLGGTEMEKALAQVMEGGDGKAADILLITDGEIWNTDATIARAHRAGYRIFAVGIGSAPAEALLTALGSATGGAASFMTPNEDIEPAVMRLIARLRSPAISGLSVDWGTAPLWQAVPEGAVFEGETVHVVAGFDRRPTGEIRLSCRRDGQPVDEPIAVALPDIVLDDDTLARVAAARRLAGLPSEERLATALRYSLVCDQTNLLLVNVRDKAEKPTELPALRRVAQMTPAGWHGLGRVRALYSHRLAEPVPAPMANVLADMQEPAAAAARPNRRDAASRSARPAAPALREPHDAPPIVGSRVRGAADGPTPRDLLAVLEQDYVRTQALTLSLAHLQRCGLSSSTGDALSAIEREGFSEKDVVVAFIVLLARLSGGTIGRMLGGPRLARQLLRAVRPLEKALPPALVRRVEAVFGRSTGAEWKVFAA